VWAECHLYRIEWNYGDLLAKELDLDQTTEHEVFTDSHEQMEGSCTEDT